MTHIRKHLPFVPTAIVATMLATALLALWTAHANPLDRVVNKQHVLAAAIPALPIEVNPVSPAIIINAPEIQRPAALPVSQSFPVSVPTPVPSPAEPGALRVLIGPLQNALGMIETGNDDRAIGGAGEVSRYQIMPSVWKHYSDSRQYRDPESSLEVAQQHWAWLYDYFKKQAGREPTDFDMYVLWNTRHGYYAARGFQPSRLGAVVRDRAQRFSNLVEDSARREATIVTTGTRG